jgi:hypothetical protein
MLAAIVLILAVRRHAVTPPVGVPAAYRDLYSTLTDQLAAAEAQLTPLHPESGPQPVYAAELLPANCNRGEALLQPGAITGVQLYLDRLRQLGLNGVTLPIGYPLLADRFPRSAEYLQFYRLVAAEVRNRGMTLDIESAVMFANSPFSPVRWDYSTMTIADLARERHDMIAKIVTELAPDYINLGSEPDTEAQLTTFTQLNTPAGYSQHLGAIIQGVDRGRTKIGAGIGTWDNLAFLDAEVLLPLDFIALHIYPLTSANAATAIDACDRARAHQKRIIVDEAWLFKQRPGEPATVAADTAIFSRDAFAFFGPLDQQFLHYLDDLARAEGIEFISPFWSGYLFAYVQYNQATGSLAYSDLVGQVNAAVVQNLINGAYSSTGRYYGSLAAGHP